MKNPSCGSINGIRHVARLAATLALVPLVSGCFPGQPIGSPQAGEDHRPPIHLGGTHRRPIRLILIPDRSGSYSAHLPAARHVIHWYLLPLLQPGTDELIVVSVQPHGDSSADLVRGFERGGFTQLRRGLAEARALVDRLTPVPGQGSDLGGVMAHIARLAKGDKQNVLVWLTDCERDGVPSVQEYPTFQGTPLVFFLNIPHPDTRTLTNRKQQALRLCSRFGIAPSLVQTWDFSETLQYLPHFGQQFGRTRTLSLRPRCAWCAANFGR